MKKISVITTVLCPSERVLKTIKKCMFSVRRAIDKVGGEYIIVDDNSAVGGDFFREIADIYFENATTMGVSYSLNKGMEASDADFVIKLDSDYFVPENLFEVLIKDWSDDLCFISPSYVIGNQENNDDFDEKKLPKTEGGIIDKPKGENKKYMYSWGGGVMMFDNKKLKEVGYFDENFGVGSGQDNDVIYRLLLKGYNWRWTNNIITRHFASISSTDSNAPDDYNKRRKIGREYFIKKHGFEPGGFISEISRHFKYNI